MIIHSNSGERGFTLVEAVVVMAIFAVIMAAMMNSIVGGQRMMVSGVAFQRAQEKAQLTIERISKELSKSAEEGTNALSFFNHTTNSWSETGSSDPTSMINAIRFQQKNPGWSDFFQIKGFLPTDANATYRGKVVIWQDLSPESKTVPGAEDRVEILIHNCKSLKFLKKSKGLVEIVIETEEIDRGVPANPPKKMECKLSTRVSIPQY